MINHCGKFEMDIFNVVDLVEVLAHARDVCLHTVDTLEFEAQNFMDYVRLFWRSSMDCGVPL